MCARTGKGNGGDLVLVGNLHGLNAQSPLGVVPSGNGVLQVRRGVAVVGATHGHSLVVQQVHLTCCKTGALIGCTCTLPRVNAAAIRGVVVLQTRCQRTYELDLRIGVTTNPPLNLTNRQRADAGLTSRGSRVLGVRTLLRLPVELDVSAHTGRIVSVVQKHQLNVIAQKAMIRVCDTDKYINIMNSTVPILSVVFGRTLMHPTCAAHYEAIGW